MSHQDWKEVVIYKPNSKKTKQTETVKRTQHNNVKEVDIAEGKTIQFVSTDLKKKIRKCTFEYTQSRNRKKYY